jgi:Nitrite and sulphite reductase 4Fe-4S domain
MSNAFKLKNGNILLSTEAPGGIYNASQLKRLAAMCDSESIIVKATEDQRLALFVNPDRASDIASELKSIGLGVRHYQDGLHQPTSCIGESCEDHEQDALGTSLDISSELDDLTLNSPLKIGINGCAKCCVPCHTLDISIVGDSTGYRISLGGKNSQLPEMASFMAEGVPAADTPRLVKSILELFKQKAQDNETLQELIEREGAGPFIEVLAPWSQDAADASGSLATLECHEEQANTEEPQNTEDPVKTFASPLDLDTDMSLALNSFADLPPESDMAAIDDSNEIQHPDLAGNEASEGELILEDSPIDTDSLTEDLAFNIVANAPTKMAMELEEITVSPTEQGHDFSMPDDISVVDEPEMNLPEIELAAGPLEDSFDEIDDLTEESFAEGFETLSTPDMASMPPPHADLEIASDVSDLELSADVSNLELAADVSDLELAADASEMELVDDDAISELVEGQPSAESMNKPQGTEHLSDSVIDAGDVLRGNSSQDSAPSIAQASDEITVAESTELVMSESDQDVEVAKISEGITAQDDISEDQQAQIDRDEGASLLESSSVSLEDDSDIQTQDYELVADELEEAHSESHSAAANTEMDHDESEGEHFEVTDHLPLSEIVTTKNFAPRKMAPHKSHWTISSFDVDDQGSPIITWTNGIAITVTRESIAKGSFRIGGNELKISKSGDGVIVEVDGVRMFLPIAA